MIQGGFLDWVLVFFTFVAARRMQKDIKNWQPILRKCFPTTWSCFIFGFGSAAVFHLVTVEVLFTGFILNKPLLIGIGSTFLVPTFFLYTFWAYSEDRLSLICGPTLFMNMKSRPRIAHYDLSQPTRLV